jgi:hypothetical protein
MIWSGAFRATFAGQFCGLVLDACITAFSMEIMKVARCPVRDRLTSV